ncbi:MAG: hypothetical protein E2O29_01990 [Deltaproteobacteria bacterium]|nr:MAG: hypothetical protein E2O29_01990 [Deltaproteobacteria bacterium]
MGFEFNQSQENTILLTVLRLSGSEPTFPADYTTPTVRISHINGGPEEEDLASTAMTRIGATNRWFFKFPIASNASFTKYLTTFNTTIDGIPTVATEEYRVVPVDGTTGSGAFAVTVTVKNSVTLVPIPNAQIRIFDKSNPAVAIAVAQTDASGNATVFLDAALYLIEFFKTGIIRETHDLVVFANGTHNVIGN